jgi:hypothetical protein
MDILNVVISKLKHEKEKSMFEINCILANPTKENAVSLILKEVENYRKSSQNLEISERLKEQISENKNNNHNS